MPSLQDSRFQEIAQYVSNANNPAAAYGKFNAAGSWAWNAQFFGNQAVPQEALAKQAYYTLYVAGLKAAGFTTSELQGYGPEFSVDAAKLQKLVSAGTISSAEANAFLLEKYPATAFSGGKFDVTAKGALSEAAVEVDAKPSSDPTVEATQSEVQIAVAQANAAAGVVQPSLQGPLPTFVIQVPKVGEEYEPRRISEALRTIAEQASIGITQVAQGNIRYQPNSVDGSALIPGTVAAEKFDPFSLSKLQRDWPDSRDAVIVRTTDDFTSDRWIVDATDFEGPGRVRRVTSVEYPVGYKPRPGPQRFRIVMDGFRFGLATLRYRGAVGVAADVTAGAGVDAIYGAVIRGIPHLLGRPPQAIVAAFAVGDVVSSASAIHTGLVWATNTTRLFHDRAHEEFDTDASLAYAGFGTSSNILPSAAELEDVRGIDLMLVTGQTQNQVYAQLNSRPTPAATIGGDNRGYPFSIPPDRAIESPFSPSAAFIQPSPSTATAGLTEVSGIASLAVARRWIEGIPMDYDTCLRLRADATQFSVWVSPRFTKTLPTTYPVVPAMSQWGETGVRVAVGENRSYAVDLIVV